MVERSAPVFAADGKQLGAVALEPGYFGIEPNTAVMHQVVTAQLAASRAGSANTKTRAEVRGGGRKPWRQKGLGRARHGSIRSPQWRGGGVAHGPKPRDFSQRTPRKMRNLALRSALSVRAADGKIVVVDPTDWAEPKTKQAAELLAAAAVDGKFLLVVVPGEHLIQRSFRNLARGLVDPVKGVSAHDVLWADTVVFTKDALASLTDSGAYEVSEDDFVPEGGDGE